MNEPPKRNLVLCAEDTSAAGYTCEWAVKNFGDEHTVFHLIYVVKSLMPPMEVFHNAPGTSYSFDQPGKHDEKKLIAAATAAIEKRYLPILQTKMVHYQLHLFAERKDASPEKVSSIIMKCAQDLNPFLVAIAAHNKPTDSDKYEGSVGSVANYMLKNCKMPLVVVRPPKQNPGGEPLNL